MNKTRLLPLIALLACIQTAPAGGLKDLLQQGVNEKLQNVLKTDGDSVMIGKVSEEQERDIGQKVAGRLLGQYPLVKDAKLQQYVNQVGRWVSMQSDRPNLHWVFGVIDSDSVNAFAVPGGYVFITKGLYQQLSNEAELAGVLGHEIAHVQQKDHLKLLQKGQWLQAGNQILGKELGNKDKADEVVGKGAELLARQLDQQAEYEADRRGLVLAARAGYEPMGLPSVLQKLDTLASQDGNRLEQLFKTHPQAADRLAELDAAVGDHFVNYKNGQLVTKRFYKLKTVASAAKK